MPESSTPRSFSGGKVIGTRSTLEKMPCLPSRVQKGVLLRSEPDPRPSQRQPVLAQADGSAGRPDFRRAEFRLIGAQVRREEVEDVVLARIDAGLKRRPGDRRDGRDGAGQRFEAPALAEGGQVRQLAFGQELLRQPVVHAVEPEDHEPLHAAAGQCQAAADRTDGPTHGPGKQHQDGGEEGRGHGKGRPGQREPRAGADVGHRRARHCQDQHGCQQRNPQGPDHFPLPSSVNGFSRHGWPARYSSNCAWHFRASIRLPEDVASATARWAAATACGNCRPPRRRRPTWSSRWSRGRRRPGPIDRLF